MLLELFIVFGLGIASGYVLREAIVNSRDDSEMLWDEDFLRQAVIDDVISKPPAFDSMAISTDDEWYVMHGHSRLYWFQRRDNDPDPVLRRLPLREYAAKKALLSQ